jgi:hypothetical protein
MNVATHKKPQSLLPWPLRLGSERMKKAKEQTSCRFACYHSIVDLTLSLRFSPTLRAFPTDCTPESNKNVNGEPRRDSARGHFFGRKDHDSSSGFASVAETSLLAAAAAAAASFVTTTCSYRLGARES